MTLQFFKPLSIRGERGLQAWKKKRASVKYVDAFESQVRELFFIENKQFIGQDKQEVEKTENFKNYAKKKAYQYFYYPWNQTLVKCINGDDYFLLKTNRNQDLITEKQQRKLYDYQVAVLGLSVGSNIALCLAQSGISRRMVLADFDVLETTNLNRLQAGVQQIGLNKAIITGQRIYEDNPYAEVKTWLKGVRGESLAKLLKRGEIDCIIEEIDDIALKISIRQWARKYHCPVIMITDNGDGVILHVERYDLGYKKVFEKDDGYWRKKIKGHLTLRERAEITVKDIVGGKDNVEARMLDSVKKVLTRKLVSWPQLGTAALLGGVVVTFAIKRMVLGLEKKPFRKEYIHPADFLT